MSDTLDSSVSSTLSVATEHGAGLLAGETEHLSASARNTNQLVIGIDNDASTSVGTLNTIGQIPKEDAVPSTSGETNSVTNAHWESTTTPRVILQSNESTGKEDVCVSTQQMNSPNSEEDEDDNSWEDQEECDNDSEISEFSDFSQESWQPVQGPIAWVQEQMRRGQSPRKILEDLVPTGTVIPEGLDPIMLWKIIINIVSEPPKRKKLNDINTLDDVLRLLNTSKNIIVLTGAGVSVSCGIPDFRSRGGVYARLAKDFPNLPDPQAMFDIHFFRSDPRPFFKFAREIYPGQFKPSPCHRFIRMLEEKGKLLRNYTQNIDTLEQVAGIQRIIQCHGSFATATCTICGHKVDSSVIKEDILNQVIPHCPKCSLSDQKAVMKPDIVFFGESLPEHFHNQMAADKDECDLLIVIGSSLKVRPVALIPNSLPARVPQILINRERLHYLNFDVELLGNCDGIIGELCRRLGPGWEELASSGPPINEILLSSLPTPPASPLSNESNDVWDAAKNSTVSSTSTPAISSKKTHIPLVASSHCSNHYSNYKETSENSISTNVLITSKDNNQEVSTSKLESRSIEIQKIHHHPHKLPLKRPVSEITESDASSNNSIAVNSKSDQATFCSAKSMETLANACHKKDVMFVPADRSFEHYSSHSQHSHDRAKSHTQSSIHERPDSPTQKHHHYSSHSSENRHHYNLASAGSSKEFVKNSKICTYEVHKKLQLGDLTEGPQILPPCNKSCEAEHKQNKINQDLDENVQRSPKRRKISQAAHTKELDTNDDCSKSKKPRLTTEQCQEKDNHVALVDEKDSIVVDVDKKETEINPFVGDVETCDSISQDESLANIRRMWHSRCRVSLAQRLEDDQVLFLPPSRYVFKGAEIFSDSESDTSDDSYDDSMDEDENMNSDDADKSVQDVMTSENDDKEKDLHSSAYNKDKNLHSSTSDKEKHLNFSKPDKGKHLDSSIHLSEEKSNSQRIIPASLSEDEQSVNGILIAENTETTQNISGKNSTTEQLEECSQSSDIMYKENKLSDSLNTCPVSSTEDLYLVQTAQISTRLHSLQDQRD